MLDPESPNNAHEARESLLQIAGRRTHPIASELVVEHVLRLPGPWDWPVRRAALEAVLRRLASARAQEIAVLEAPRRGPWGRYRMVRADADGRCRTTCGCGRCPLFAARATAPTSRGRRWGFASTSRRSWGA